MGKCKIFWTEEAERKLEEAGRMYFKSLDDETITKLFNIILNDTKKNT